MRFLGWILRGVVFLVLLGFALKNTEMVTVRLLLGGEWRAPLVLIVFIMTCAGAILGVLACLSWVYRQRQRILALQRELATLRGSIAAAAMAPAPDERLG